MNRQVPEQIVATLLEVEFDPRIEDVASAALIEPEHFMDAKSSDSPYKRNWLERRYELVDSTLDQFRVTLSRRPDWFDIAYGFDTDMRYHTLRLGPADRMDKAVFFKGLKRILDEVIPPLVDKLDHDKVTAGRFSSKVTDELISLKKLAQSAI